MMQEEGWVPGLVTWNTVKLENYLAQFKRAKNGALAKQWNSWVAERVAKDAFVSRQLSLAALDSFAEDALSEMLRLFWAFKVWRNKEALLAKISSQGMARIRDGLRMLLYGAPSLADRFDRVTKSTSHFGPAVISEILAHHDPQQFALYNKQVVKAILELAQHPEDFPKSVVTGRHYLRYCEIARSLLAVVRGQMPEIRDLLDLNLLLWFLCLKLRQPRDETQGARPDRAASDKRRPESEDFAHDEIVAKLVRLGQLLGFDARKEQTTSRGCRIDVIWTVQVARLGEVIYAFEVHRRGSLDSAILNLQRISREPRVQKLILVSLPQEIARFRSEIESLEDHRLNKAMAYLTVDEVHRATAHMESVHAILESVGIVGVHVDR
ncbi:MAG: hypothetical protein NZM42_14355 [Gemmatales bacterium]|nr:hypothetical protein [Gemmatales bacterium]MDW8223506.1 hypothetical protein [Gemmatales bacterium]